MLSRLRKIANRRAEIARNIFLHTLQQRLHDISMYKEKFYKISSIQSDKNLIQTFIRIQTAGNNLINTRKVKLKGVCTVYQTTNRLKKIHL